jgi:hypothetical protein
MNGRRPLAELLTELADSAAAFADVTANMPVRARSLSLSLPIDLRLASTDKGLEVIGDVPLFLTRTEFDPDPVRLKVDWHAIPLPSEEAS